MSKARIRKAALSLTDAAVSRIKSLITAQSQSSNKSITGIRLGVRSRGCNGLSYTINYVDTEQAPTLTRNDELVPISNDIKVYIDPKALFYIVGSEMDYIENELTAEFKFKNPNEKGKCGCGESFNV